MTACEDPRYRSQILGTGEFKTDDGLPRDFLSCGKYFYDGNYNVVQLKKGINFFHGSSILADKLFAFPLGVSFYSSDHEIKGMDIRDVRFTQLVANTPEEIIEILSENTENKVVPGWFSTDAIAKLYSDQPRFVGDIRQNVCRDKCVLVFTLNKDATFLLLNDPFNFKKLRVSLRPAEQKHFEAMFNNTKGQEIHSNMRMFGHNQVFVTSNPFHYVEDNPNLVRTSNREDDLPLTEGLCKTLFAMLGYAGYIAPKIGEFHSEITFCNPAKWLERNLSHPQDWQYSIAIDSTIQPNLSRLITSMKMFKTTNVNFHSGDLYEHSVWTLLWAEKLAKQQPVFPPEINFGSTFDRLFELTKMGIIVSFIHDIGKQATDIHGEVFKKVDKDEYVFYDVTNHSFIGAGYIGKDQLAPPIQMRPGPSLTGFLQEVGINHFDPIRDPALIAFLIYTHRDFGTMVLRSIRATPERHGSMVINVRTPDSEIERLVLAFINHLKAKWEELNITFKFTLKYAMIAMLIGSADALGSVPFGIDRFEKKEAGQNLNKPSMYINGISNVPALYVGNRHKPDFEWGVILKKYTLAQKAFVALFRRRDMRD